MRKNSAFLVGAATGVCLTLALVQPRGLLCGAPASAAGSTDTDAQLKLLGDVF